MGADEKFGYWNTVKEAACYSRTSEATLRREIRCGALRAYRVGGRRALRITARDLNKFMEAYAAFYIAPRNRRGAL